MDRPEFYRFHQGEKALPFSPAEYDARLARLRQDMEAEGIGAVVLTSMHNIAYHSGFLYCAFGRPYALVVTASDSVVISAGDLCIRRSMVAGAMSRVAAGSRKASSRAFCASVR